MAPTASAEEAEEPLAVRAGRIVLGVVRIGLASCRDRSIWAAQTMATIVPRAVTSGDGVHATQRNRGGGS